MKSFLILANESYLRTKEQGVQSWQPCLKQDTIAFYHEDYRAGKYKELGTIENMIVTLKGDFNTANIRSVSYTLEIDILMDLLDIVEKVFRNSGPIRVCVVPRAKRDDYYNMNPKLFRETVQNAISGLPGRFEDGVFDIERHTNTMTTHSVKSGYAGDGEMPYCGITKETCTISNKVAGKKIILIDDLYTKGVGIDEDAIQALYDNGAEKVVFYSIGKTIKGINNL